MFRFSLQQLLLLLVLVAIFGGYFSAAMSRPYRFDIDSVTVSPNGRTVVTCGNDGLQVMNLDTGGCRSIQPDQDVIGAFMASEVEARLIDDDTLVYSRSIYGQGHELIYFSVKDSSVLNHVSVSHPVSLSGLNSQFGLRTAAFWTDTGFSFYDLPSGNRIRLKAPGDDAQIEFCNFSGDGRFALQRMRNQDNSRFVRIFDLTENKQIDRWDVVSNAPYHLSHDGSRMLTHEGGRIRLLNTSDRSEISTLSPGDNGAPGNGSQILVNLSGDGSRFVIKCLNRPVRIISLDASSGIQLSDCQLPDSIDVSSIKDGQFSRDGLRLFLPGSNTDEGLRVVDTQTGQQTASSGWHPRKLMPTLFSILFIGWSVLWGWLHYRSPVKRKMDPVQTADIVDPFGDEPEPVVAAAVDSAMNENTFDAQWMRKNEASLTTVRIMMISGGIFAILFAVIPSFFRYSTQWLPFATSGYYWLALVWTSFGLLTGVAATANGLARSKSGLRTIASMQILNLINCDPINGLMGIIQTIQLNMPALRRYLDIPPPPLERQD